MINQKMAAILGMDVPEEANRGEVITVEPHEITRVDNPDLPPLHDIERKHLQAEKQLEEVIEFTLGYQRSMFEEVSSVEPKYRSRYIEVANGTLSLALEAIKTKLKTQENRREQRLKEADFSKTTNQGNGDTNNFFFGTREEAISVIRESKKTDDNDEKQ